MNMKKFAILSILIVGAMLVTPAFAKTKTEIKAIQMGSIDVSTADKVLETPNGKIQQFWGVDGSGVVTLYLSDGITVIDTFVSYSETHLKAKDSTTLGFVDGSAILIIKMRWESDTVTGGFEGVIRFWKVEGSPAEMRCVYQGFGAYEGQTLKMQGTAVPGVQTYTGTLIG